MFAILRFLRKIYKKLKAVPKPFWVALEIVLSYIMEESKKNSKSVEQKAKHVKNIFKNAPRMLSALKTIDEMGYPFKKGIDDLHGETLKNNIKQIIREVEGE